MLLAVLAVVLYPASLGLSYLDPYRWGYQPQGLLLALAVPAVLAALYRLGLTLALLTLPVLAYALRPDDGNLWNYLLDPLLGLYAVAWVVLQALRGGWRLARRRPFAQSRAARADGALSP